METTEKPNAEQTVAIQEASDALFGVVFRLQKDLKFFRKVMFPLFLFSSSCYISSLLSMRLESPFIFFLLLFIGALSGVLYVLVRFISYKNIEKHFKMGANLHWKLVAISNENRFWDKSYQLRAGVKSAMNAYNDIEKEWGYIKENSRGLHPFLPIMSSLLCSWILYLWLTNPESNKGNIDMKSYPIIIKSEEIPIQRAIDSLKQVNEQNTKVIDSLQKALEKIKQDK